MSSHTQGTTQSTGSSRRDSTRRTVRSEQTTDRSREQSELGPSKPLGGGRSSPIGDPTLRMPIMLAGRAVRRTIPTTTSRRRPGLLTFSDAGQQQRGRSPYNSVLNALAQRASITYGTLEESCATCLSTP